MAFGFADWIIGKAFDSAFSATGSKLKAKSIKDKLNKVIDTWTNTLPKGCELVSISMYFGSEYEDIRDIKSIQLLNHRITSGEIPSEYELFNALFERWSICKALPNKQPFFNLPEETAKHLLVSLASMLTRELVQEQSFFRIFVHNALLEVKEHLRVLLQDKERLNVFTNTFRKQFRPIPPCDFLLPMETHETQKILIAFVFKIALYKTFKDHKYKSFSAVFAYDDNYTVFENGESGPGFTIFTGEVIFISNLIRLINLIMNNRKKFGEEVEKYMSISDFDQIKIKVQLVPSKLLTAYTFEIDNQLGTYSIKPIFDHTLDYEKLCSLNAMWPFIASTNSSIFHVLDFDKLAENSAILKFIYYLIDKDTLNLSLIKINVDDFDDWDFEYVVN